MVFLRPYKQTRAKYSDWTTTASFRIPSNLFNNHRIIVDAYSEILINNQSCIDWCVTENPGLRKVTTRAYSRRACRNKRYLNMRVELWAWTKQIHSCTLPLKDRETDTSQDSKYRYTTPFETVCQTIPYGRICAKRPAFSRPHHYSISVKFYGLWYVMKHLSQ